MAKKTNADVRAQLRAERAEALRKEQAARERKRRLRLGGIVAGGVGLAGLGVWALVSALNSTSVQIEGLQTFNHTTVHVSGEVEYEQNPPAGGEHSATWLNCGIYDLPVPNEYAVHSLEHGAVWVTYDPDLPFDDVEALREKVPATYSILSPYPDLPAPVVVSSWNRQLYLTGADDERLDEFIQAFWRASDVPEPNSACWNGIDAPGRVS